MEYAVMACSVLMETYSTTLKAHLAGKQEEFAARIGKTQGAVSRYAKGLRFPDAETARAIDRATDGKVPFALWQVEAMRRLGIAA